MSDGTIDEVLDFEAEHLAGRLMLMLHLVDSRNGWIGESGMRNDHVRLRNYGYDVSGCPCALTEPELSVSVWRERIAEIRSS